MNDADPSPNPAKIAAWRSQAVEYLREQLGNDAPMTLDEPIVFPRSPLDGDGPTAVFEFTSARGGGESRRYYAVAGETEPNYYPAEDLTPEEAFELHLGTRFMLVLGVAQIPDAQALADDTYDIRRDAEEIVGRVNVKGSADDLQLAAMFDVEGQKHAVLRCRIAGRSVYIMGRDAPQGFSTKTHLAPHVAYRLHIGHVLRREARPDAN